MDHYVHGFRVNRPFSEHFRAETPSSRAFRHYASRHKTRILPCAFYRTKRILSRSRKPFSKTEMFFKRWIYKNSYLVVWLGLFPTRIIVPGKRFADSPCMHSIFISRNEISRFIELVLVCHDYDACVRRELRLPRIWSAGRGNCILTLWETVFQCFSFLDVKFIWSNNILDNLR